MLRRILLYLAAATWARGIVSDVGIARRMARRFIAGESISEALDTARTLNDQGLLVTLDYLGESVTAEADTREVVDTYTTLITQIADRELRASVSLKLTHLGLDISAELCVNNLRRILSAAQAREIAVTIDMEASEYLQRTLDIFRTMLHEYEFANVGTVIQAYLRRTPDDMRQLAAEGATIRLVKGAYLEPAEIAFPDKADVDATFAAVMRDYLAAPAPAVLQIATHDERLISEATAIIARDNLHDRAEVQMLYGIRSARQLELAQAGFPTRVYLPFGEAWYPYFMRRLAERPANLWFIVRSLFRR